MCRWSGWFQGWFKCDMAKLLSASILKTFHNYFQQKHKIFFYQIRRYMKLSIKTFLIMLHASVNNLHDKCLLINCKRTFFCHYQTWRQNVFMQFLFISQWSHHNMAWSTFMLLAHPRQQHLIHNEHKLKAHCFTKIGYKWK